MRPSLFRLSSRTWLEILNNFDLEAGFGNSPNFENFDFGWNLRDLGTKTPSPAFRTYISLDVDVCVCEGWGVRAWHAQCACSINNESNPVLLSACVIHSRNYVLWRSRTPQSFAQIWPFWGPKISQIWILRASLRKVLSTAFDSRKFFPIFGEIWPVSTANLCLNLSFLGLKLSSNLDFGRIYKCVFVFRVRFALIEVEFFYVFACYFRGKMAKKLPARWPRSCRYVFCFRIFYSKINELLEIISILCSTVPRKFPLQPNSQFVSKMSSMCYFNFCG